MAQLYIFQDCDLRSKFSNDVTTDDIAWLLIVFFF